MPHARLWGRVSFIAFSLVGGAMDALGARARKSLSAFHLLIAEIRALPPSPVRAVVEATIRISGYEKALLAENTPEATIRVENVLELVSAAEEYDRKEPGGNVDGFLEEVALISDVDQLTSRNRTSVKL